MRLLLALSTSLLPFIAGCIANAGEASQPVGTTVRLSWETLVTIYGPMAGMLLWFMWRDKIRCEDEKKRNDTLIALVGDCTETIISVNATLVQLRAENEKHRTAIYRLDEDVREVKAVVVASNTRIIRKDE